MDLGFYAIDVWGEELPGASRPRRCTLSGVAKRNSEQVPYAVANEYICGRLGMLIGLPVPPGVVATTDEDELAFVSLRFGPKEERPPPLHRPDHLVEDYPSIAAGIIAFDCWIGNPDRHQENLAYIRGEAQVPVTVFDHSHAFFGHERGKATNRLLGQIDEPLISGSILLPHITSSREFGDWADRIRAVSDGLVRDICGAVVRPGGITEGQCAAAVKFLTHRKERILEKIRESEGAMPNVHQWPLQQD